MNAPFPGAAALASYIRTGNREDRIAYRNLPDKERAVYGELVDRVYERAIDRYFAKNLDKGRVDRLIVRIARRHPEYGGSVKRLLRSLVEGEERRRELAPLQLLTAQHLVIQAVSERHLELQQNAEQLVDDVARDLRWMLEAPPETPAIRATASVPVSPAVPAAPVATAAPQPVSAPPVSAPPVSAPPSVPQTTEPAAPKPKTTAPKAAKPSPAAPAVAAAEPAAPVRRPEPAVVPKPKAEPKQDEEKKESDPSDFKVPDSYEDQLKEGKDFLVKIPDGPNKDMAEKVLATAPSREDIEKLQARAAEGRALLASIQESRFEGRAADGAVRVVVDATGEIRKLELDPTAARLGNRELAAAIGAALAEAEEQRSENDAKILERGKSLGGRTGSSSDAAGAQQESEETAMLRKIEEFVEKHENDRFSSTSDTDMCRAAVNQRGFLVDLVFLTANVLKTSEREEVSADVIRTITAARSKANGAISAMTMEILGANG
ncbi:YbaB/EbfC family nucleoid-associated protein [Glycomyces buryatensis]|uniref:YbaB/EbfC family nucleoid-associated protein n=1 Tax=Glycomyces buryatensis TaxID=2570927 RepID=A0A4S8QJ01_9ACTN|nr:YbaB/EbfC family nucleoid-associated protein [Glycomyces buryatensis]THV42985.1 YbaB/EbfC family nucleoid-associated protein [Glycomyces buryatensis]